MNDIRDNFKYIIEVAEEVSDAGAPDDYVESVTSKAESIIETIDEWEEYHRQPSEKQRLAMENMAEGFRRWLEH